MSRILLLGALIIIISFTVKAQKTSSFPIHIIDTAIINKRGLQEKIRMLVEDCNWSERTGKKIDVFWLQTPNGNFFGHSYEYFMDCDNLRLIYWYDKPGTKGRPVDFMIENLEDESKFVNSKRKHLKNKKKYQHLLKENTDS